MRRGGRTKTENDKTRWRFLCFCDLGPESIYRNPLGRPGGSREPAGGEFRGRNKDRRTRVGIPGRAMSVIGGLEESDVSKERASWEGTWTKKFLEVQDLAT